MLILVLALCLLTSVFVALRRRDSLALYMLGMSMSVCLMLAGIIVYIAKVGGIAATQTEFLFLVPGLQRWLQYQPLSMNKLGYVVAVGRCLFPLFALLAALETTMLSWIRRRLKFFRSAAFILPALFLVYYYPTVFQTLIKGHFGLLRPMIWGSLLWILLYLVLAAGLMAAEYRAISMHFFKQNFRYVLSAFFGIGILYLLYATKDPAQIYNFFIAEYIRLGVSTFIGPGLSSAGWFTLGVGTVFLIILGSYGMVRYTQISYDEERQDLILQRKFDTAGAGVSIFVHGIKNQLLSSRVLHKKLKRALEEGPPNLEQARACAEQLGNLNEGMLARMDELYQSVKSNALTLTAIPIGRVMDSAIERFHGKYPEQRVAVQMETEQLVLADLGHLSEAIYNLLTNACEAARAAGRQAAEVSAVIRGERMWTVIEIRDNGEGISKEIQGKIYDPFFTSKNTNHNWGMGLYYVRRVVKGHWGRMRLDSSPGKGTSFYIMLPLFDADARR